MNVLKIMVFFVVVVGIWIFCNNLYEQDKQVLHILHNIGIYKPSFVFSSLALLHLKSLNYPSLAGQTEKELLQENRPHGPVYIKKRKYYLKQDWFFL